MRTPERLKSYLAKHEALYPGVWKQFDRFRSMRGRELPRWPDWCWCPLAGAYAVISGGGSNRAPLEAAFDIGVLGALAAWRKTQVIYRFDGDLFAALWSTPIEGDMPSDVLYHLPEWCVYIEAPPDLRWTSRRILGWFTHLECDANDGRTELRLVFDFKERLHPFPVHLHHATLEQCVEVYIAESNFQAGRQGMETQMPGGVQAEIARSIAPLISVTLYLCSAAADIRDHHGRRTAPGTAKHRHEHRSPTDPPTSWDVGFRVGAALRAALKSEGGESAAALGGHAGPRPHIRRAHWHSSWTRPMDKPDDRKAILKWLPPIPINLDQGEVIPTLHKVKGK